MTIHQIRAQLWARTYAGCLERGALWFEAKNEAAQAVYWFDRRDEPQEAA
jgi:hypothetical protein